MIYYHLQESFLDRYQVYLVDQRATPLLGRSVRPHLNREERAIYLVESSSQHVHSELVRMLTFAMRESRLRSTPAAEAAILEDSFAIFLNQRLSPISEVFPFYGAHYDIVAHHLHSSQPYDLVRLWESADGCASLHERVLSGAFLLYLGDTFGDSGVVRLATNNDTVTARTFDEHFGGPLSVLERHWREHLPVALLSITREEYDEMIRRWDETIDCKRH
jgi:hypothetical protein